MRVWGNVRIKGLVGGGDWLLAGGGFCEAFVYDGIAMMIGMCIATSEG